MIEIAIGLTLIALGVLVGTAWRIVLVRASTMNRGVAAASAVVWCGAGLTTLGIWILTHL